LISDRDRAYRYLDGSIEEWYEDLRCSAPVRILPSTPHSLSGQLRQDGDVRRPAVGRRVSGGVSGSSQQDSSLGIGEDNIPGYVHRGKWRRRCQPAVGKGRGEENAGIVGALAQRGLGGCDGFAEPGKCRAGQRALPARNAECGEWLIIDDIADS
jgi:hypothetical protein